MPTRRPILPALICLAAMGCSHRHLVLEYAPFGTRAVADRVASGWRITLEVQEPGWEATPREALVLERKDLGDRTRIQWLVSADR